MRFVTMTLAAVLIAGPGFAQTAPPLRLGDSSAQAIIEGCAVAARGKSQSHAIVVVDNAGVPVASLRMDGNGAGIYEFAEQKAKAVAAWGFSTAQMAESAKSTPGFAAAPHVVIVPGGVPVFSSDGKVFLGAVGVSGESAADDLACAEAALRRRA